ncbi:hypothetical protein GPJ56_001241 [Histomonas meleagridis]|uniref:uncharacterized protein n=1 Tax=Histomonas meleagridis TaxID=135588 RepID=UPI00355987D6|nr:hypothetical protein GPJ56_001241 [Histomonas meleagridis]KAH0797629.1 hypothetical protein GO595_009258 [Histomonas meleagridis]
MKNLGESIGKIQTKSSKDYDLPISFYLVEENGTKTQEIFVISNYKSAEHAFIPLLNRYNCFNGKTINVCKKHSEKCDKETVCIVHLTPVIENDTRTQEFPHTWYKFRTIPTAIDNDNKYQYVEYLTNEALPRYKWSSKVKSSKTVIMTENEYVTQKYNKTIELLNKTADEFEIWFPYPDNHQNKAIKPKEGLFTLDIHRISDVLSSNLKGTDSFVSLLSKFKETNEKDAMKMANGVRTAAIRCVNVYRRAVENLQTKQAYEQLLPFLETMVGDFTEQFGLEPMEKESYSCLDDPMEDGIEFSE